MTDKEVLDFIKQNIDKVQYEFIEGQWQYTLKPKWFLPKMIIRRWVTDGSLCVSHSLTYHIRINGREIKGENHRPKNSGDFVPGPVGEVYELLEEPYNRYFKEQCMLRREREQLEKDAQTLPIKIARFFSRGKK